MRRLIAGTGWKMNIGAADAERYGARVATLLASLKPGDIEIFVLPPFTSLHAARRAFAATPVGIGGQNMHWDASGAWTGEISAPMLVEAGCKYVELAHSERLAHFGETYERVRLKINAALTHCLVPVLCLGETADDKRRGVSDVVLKDQMILGLADCSAANAAVVVLAYEPRWAIGAAAAASPDYAGERHAALRGAFGERFGREAAARVRIVYGGSVTAGNGSALMAHREIDGLFVGRAAWTPEGFAEIVAIVANAAAERRMQ
jgi:triosephosphate isomerase